MERYEDDYPEPTEQPPVVHLPADVGNDMLPVVEGMQRRMFCSLPQSTISEKLRVAAMLQADHKPLVDCANTTILAEHYIVTTVQKVDDETGEVLTLPFVILIDDKGNSFQTFGSVPCRCLAQLTQLIGPPQWNPPIPLKVKPRSFGTDRRSVVLEPDYEAYIETSVSGKKKK